MLGDGFDDSWQPPPRPPRPQYFRLADLEDAFLSGNQSQIDTCRSKLVEASAGVAGAWTALLRDTVDLCSGVVLGNFVEVLQSSSAARLVGAADEFDAAECKLSVLASVGGFMRKRILRFLEEGDVDEYSDPSGSSETPRAYRAFCVALVASAALNLYVQVRLNSLDM
jgi:hypothetical protein